ncbi:DHA2 family efflux MFS transporter permease subunit [Lysinibacillus yapensis]|uniref:DHA2 family efflux MFS transporter permease subunit n=1 Tax=Ureibacillus yapensis TaxID=2304605 RepID=A0A396SAX8_9BACL|nr:DHA2 family efflux MFS transporter permease subunit [Lysinibacillus yapensis]RHW32395.1 DHA2 family efflux MFS transporter permease subunit [Lysinibacillus yapensis]
MHSEQTAKKPPYLMIAILFVGTFVAFLNNTLLNVALPTIMVDLDVTYATVQWLATGYMLVSGVLVPASAFLITRFKTRPLFIFAMAVFTIGTLLAATAPTFALLLAGRMVQAVGASVMSPLLMNVMLISFPVEKRGAAMGMFGLVMIAAPAIGPTLSGWIVEHYDWRVLFEMILPIAVISLLLSIWKLQNVLPNKHVTLDYFSIVLSTIGFGGLLYGVSTAGNDGWTDPIVLATVIIGIIGIVLFVVRQVKLETPVLSMEIFKSPLFALSAVISAVLSMALMGGMILTPAYVQSVRGIHPFESGLMMLPGALVMAVMSPITGRLFDRIGPRILAIVGLTITAIATYMLSFLDVDSTYSFIISIYTIRMLGISLVMMPIMTNGLNSLPGRLNPHGTAANNTVQQLAGSLGTAILVAVMNARTTSAAEDLAAKAKSQVTGAMTEEQIAAMKAQIGQQALLDGIQFSFVVATIITVVALILSLFLKRAVSPDNVKQVNASQPRVVETPANATLSK